MAATVFIIDDEEMMCILLTEMVRAWNPKINICTFTSPQDALEEIDDEIPDLIIADQVMPEINGISLVRELRMNQIHTPVILVSGQLNSVTESVASSMALTVIEKPVAAHILTAEIERILKPADN